LTNARAPLQSAVAAAIAALPPIIRETSVRVLIFLTAVALAFGAEAAPVTVAVASNFSTTANAIAKKFAGSSDVEINFSAGSSGKLVAQIENGAPFDIFLSADAERPERLEQKGLAVAGSRFTYALGRIVLWSAAPGLKGQDCKAALASGNFRHIAIANPATAPYGVAATRVLEGLGLTAPKLGDRLVMGENIAQTLQFVATGSAELGFIALSQLRGKDAPAGSCQWTVPAESHAPIVQQAALLKRGAGNRGAVDFFNFLKSDAARELIRNDGYDLTP
jgi:molybdate transport system substrate-binding protein